MGFDNFDQYLRSMELMAKKVPSFNLFPFCLPAIKHLGTLTFHPKVTFIIGENGSGKSTILEAIAIAYGFNPEGGSKNFNFSTRESHSELYNYIKLIKGVKKPRDGFFLRAESFYNLASEVDNIEDILQFYGGVSLHNQSHGESFLALFVNRFNGKGLYILDEPEAALSPSRQMSMISRIHDLVKMDSQFIIATHSPIIMAYPDAVIYKVDEDCKKMKYEETEHFQIMKAFVNNPQKMLDILME